MFLKCVWRRGRYDRINGGVWLVELAAASREVAQGKGARSTSTNGLEVEPTLGLELDTKSEEDSRRSRSGKVERRRSSRSTKKENMYEGLRLVVRTRHLYLRLSRSRAQFAPQPLPSSLYAMFLYVGYN
jgi:hypothetical protein